jgi:hypothetical protein
MLRHFFLVILLAAISVRAETVELTRNEAYELHTALSALAPGLSPDATLAAADDINALQADADAFRQGYAKLLQLQQTANASNTAEAVASFHEADAKFSAAISAKKAYDLSLVPITKEDIAAAHLSASTVATIKRLLRPKK